MGPKTLFQLIRPLYYRIAATRGRSLGRFGRFVRHNERWHATTAISELQEGENFLEATKEPNLLLP